MPRPFVASRHLHYFHQRSSIIAMKGKRFATSACACTSLAAAAALVGRQEGQADAFLHHQSGGISGISLVITGGSVPSAVSSSPADLSANRRAHRAVAFGESNNSFGHTMYSRHSIRLLNAA